MLLTPKDLSFVGYTYKNFEAVKGLRHSFGKRSISFSISFLSESSSSHASSCNVCNNLYYVMSLCYCAFLLFRHGFGLILPSSNWCITFMVSVITSLRCTICQHFSFNRLELKCFYADQKWNLHTHCSAKLL